MRFPLCLLLCTVFLLNAAVFVDLALYLAVCGLASVELFLLSYHSRASRTSGTDSSAAYLCCVELFYLSLSSSFVGSRWCNFLPGDCAAVCSRSASLHPATELRSARGRASVCSGPCCESSSGSSALLMARVESRQFSAQPFLKLRHVQVSRMSSFHLGHFLCRIREANSLAFLTEITRSLCN